MLLCTVFEVHFPILSSSTPCLTFYIPATESHLNYPDTTLQLYTSVSWFIRTLSRIPTPIPVFFFFFNYQKLSLSFMAQLNGIFFISLLQTSHTQWFTLPCVLQWQSACASIQTLPWGQEARLCHFSMPRAWCTYDIAGAQQMSDE